MSKKSIIIISNCPNSEYNNCIKNVPCKYINQKCQFVNNNLYRKCQKLLNNDAKPCVKSGCSGELCIEEGASGISPCIWKPEFQCYKDARCEIQPNGNCEFTKTIELINCLNNPPIDT